MNKFEKLIEYIINDEDQKARELFHTIVVEKSRDIYEAIMDEEQMQEKVHGDQIGDMVREVGAEEAVHEEDDDSFDDHDDEGDENDADFSLDHEGEDDEPAGEFPAGDQDGNETEHEIEDQVMSIDSKLDELLAKFDEIMGGSEHDMEPPMDGGMEEPGMDHEMSAEPPMDEMFMEDEDEDKDEDKDEDDDKEEDKKKMKTEAKETSGDRKEDAKMRKAEKETSKTKKNEKGGAGEGGMKESRQRSVSELMREYVEKIEDINLTPSTYSEGEPVGAGTGTKKVAVNTKSTGLDKGPDFGGTSENILNGKGNNESPDGKYIPKPNSPYNTSAPQEHPVAKKNVNVPGGNAGKTSFKHQEPGHGAEKKDNKDTGKLAGAGTGNAQKPNINKKSELGQAGQPTGKKI
jgi:hypothetical protein